MNPDFAMKDASVYLSNLFHIWIKRGLMLAVFCSLTLLSGCANIKSADKSVKDASETVESEQAKAMQAEPVGTRTSAAWLLGDMVQVQPEVSPILLRNIAWKPAKKVSLAELAAYVTSQVDLPVDVSEVMHMGGSVAQDQLIAPSIGPGGIGATIQPPTGVAAGVGAGSRAITQLPLLTVTFQGNVKGLLDYAANEEGLWWKLDDGAVEFYRTVTKTFYIPIINRKSNGNSSIVSQTGGSGSSSGSGSAGGLGGASSGSGGSGSSGSSGSSNDNDSYDIDFWKNIDQTVKAIAGANGGSDAEVAADASLMSITVTGSPMQVKKVETWAKGITDRFSQQILLTMQSYSVTLSNEDNYNFSPTTIFNKMSTKYGLSLASAGAPPVTGSLAPMIVSATGGSGSKFSGSEVAFSALSTLGHVSEGITQSVMTMNGQPASIQVANQVTYLASSGSSLVANAGSSSQLTPGVVSSGLTVKFHPYVVNGKVLVTVDMSDIVLNGIDQITSDGSTIQTPNTSPTTFEESASLTPGSAMVLSTIKIDNSAVNRSGTGSAFNPLLGGGVDGTRGKKLVAIVITARVL